MELWDRNICIDLNGKGIKMQTRLIKTRVFSHIILTSTAFCVFINSNVFNDALGSTVAFKVPYCLTNSRKTGILKKGDNSVLESNF